MSKRLNTCILLGTLVLTMSFFACGDSGSTDTPKGTDMSVSAMEWLPNCTENREGMTAFVEEDNATYECKSGKWRQHDIYKEIDENNATKSSNSQEVESVNLSSLASTAESSSSFNPFNPDIEYGELTDSRDGQTYKTVVIGSQTWMAQNLNFKADSSFCFNNEENNCTKYGRLYTWAAAVGKPERKCGYGHKCSLPSDDVQGVCPIGWHLPSNTEWETLINTAGGKSRAGEYLKSTSGWPHMQLRMVDGVLIRDGNGSGFSALPAGERENGGEFDYERDYAYFWSSTEVPNKDAYTMRLNNRSNDAELFSTSNSYIDKMSDNNKSNGFSVRCLKDSIVADSSSSLNQFNPDIEYGELTDSRDGQTYKTVVIGSRTWMAENLNYETDSSFCYNNEASNCTKYGRLYRWAAAVGKSESECGYDHTCSLPSENIQGVCPSGWHLPSQTEWNALFSTVGGSSTAGEVLKSASGWKGGGNGTDAFGFSALPAGGRDASGYYLDEGYYAYFWSSAEFKSYYAYNMYLHYSFAYASLNYDDKSLGFSVRCLKDDTPEQTEMSSSSVRSSSSSEEKYGTLTDARDGQIYKTVKIGDQVWMAENLNYREGHGFCYNSTICTKYGRLYAWSDALNACPSGWHLPTKAEFETLIDIVGGQSTAGKILKSTSSWKNGGNGTDAFGFSALPAGFVDYLLNYSHEGYVAYFWSSTEDGNIIAYNMVLYDSRDHANLLSNSKDDGYSIRCLKDSP